MPDPGRDTQGTPDGSTQPGGSGGAGSGGASGLGGSGTGGSGTGGGGNGTGGTGGSGGAGSGGRGGTAGASVVVPRGGRCTPPAGANPGDIQAAYAAWKADLVTTNGARGYRRVLRPNSSGAVVNSTVSEGIAYGMLAAVYMNDQELFDDLWLYSQEFLDGNGLMHWYIGPDEKVLGQGAASDSDEDIAFALLMADKRWGGGGKLKESYLAAAKRQIDLIWRFEVDHTRGDVLTPGDQFGGGAIINISYFAPAFYRAFGRATGQVANWERVAKASYDVIEKTLTAQNKNAANGLVPAWSTPDGTPMAPPGSGHPIHHQLDSCRTPYRIAQDYCWNNEPRALAYLEKINAFHASQGAANIVDGYNLDGTPRPQFAPAGSPDMQSAAFVGPAGVGAMATASHSRLRDDAYTLVATRRLIAGSHYYNKSWTVLSLVMMAGLMDDWTLP